MSISPNYWKEYIIYGAIVPKFESHIHVRRWARIMLNSKELEQQGHK